MQHIRQMIMEFYGYHSIQLPKCRFSKIDQVCEPQKLFTNHILVIPYQPVPLSELGRYVMLPALAEFQHPDTSEELEIYLKSIISYLMM